MVDFSRYENIVAYGIGQYYDYIKKRINHQIKFTYLCDANWEKLGPSLDGIEVISPEKLADLDDTFVVLFSGNSRNYNSLASMVEKMGHDYAHISELVKLSYEITGKELKMGVSPYVDEVNNTVIFASDIEDSIVITFFGTNNTIDISEHVSVGSLKIICGQNSKVRIEKGTEIEEAKIIVTDGCVSVGSDCLFSTEIVIRNTDSHHIFDNHSGKRINYAGNINIGNHVWIGNAAYLLGDFSIGNNSVVGARAVSSSSFPSNVVIAGNSAKIIREDISWSKDSTFYYNHDFFDACIAKEAEKY